MTHGEVKLTISRSFVAVLAISTLTTTFLASPVNAAAPDQVFTAEKLSGRVLHELGEHLKASRPASYAGLSIEADGRKAVLHVKVGSDFADLARVANTEIERARLTRDPAEDADPARATLHIAWEKRSMADLAEIRKRATDTAWTSGLQDRLSRDYVWPETNQVVVALTTVSDADRAAAAKHFGEAVKLIQAERGKKAYNRLADAPPWYSGIRIYKSPGPGWCSAGFTVYGGGSYYMLTSGHCGAVGMGWTNNGATVGSTYYRDFTYGGYDTALIGGGSYTAWMYNGDLNSSSALLVKGVFYPNNGNYVCVSGAATGNYCNMYVDVQAAKVQVVL